MKRVSLIGIIVSILMVLSFAVPVFAHWDVTDVDSSEDWLSNQPEADALSTTISVTVEREASGQGQIRAEDLDVNKNMDISSAVPSTWVTVNHDGSTTFTWTVSVNSLTTDGNVNVDGEFGTKEWEYSGGHHGHWEWKDGRDVDFDVHNLFGVDSTDPNAVITITNGIITVTPTDSGSGIRSYSITVDGKVYDGTAITGVGVHNILVTVEDNAGNESTSTAKLTIEPKYGASAGSAGGWAHVCSKCGTTLQSAWLASQVGQKGFYGWDYSTIPATLIGICGKCGNR